VAKLGFLAKGLLYAVVGLIAIEVAWRAAVPDRVAVNHDPHRGSKLPGLAHDGGVDRGG
jgi:hypothetical protein